MCRGRILTLMLWAAVSLTGWTQSGCGTVFQTIAGYDQDDTKMERVAGTLEIASLPEGAEVSTIEGDQAKRIGTTPLHQTVSYEREVTVRSNASMRPFWIGTIVDALLVAGSGVAVGIGASHLDRSDDRAAAWTLWGLYIPTALVSEVIVGGILMSREPHVVRRHDLPSSYEYSFRKAGYPLILARVDVPIVTKLTVPLDAPAALQLNKPGGSTTLMFARDSTVAAPLER